MTLTGADLWETEVSFRPGPKHPVQDGTTGKECLSHQRLPRVTSTLPQRVINMDWLSLLKPSHDWTPGITHWIKDNGRSKTKPEIKSLQMLSCLVFLSLFPPKWVSYGIANTSVETANLPGLLPSSSASSSPSLFFLFLPLPSAPTAYFASTSVSLPKEQDHVIFCSKRFDFSPFCYKTNFLNCHSGHGLLCPPISSDLLPPSPVPCSTPATPVTEHTRTFLSPRLCSHGALRSGVRPHKVSTCWDPTCFQGSAHAHRSSQYACRRLSIPPKGDPFIRARNPLPYMQFMLNKYKKGIKWNPSSAPQTHIMFFMLPA